MMIELFFNHLLDLLQICHNVGFFNLLISCRVLFESSKKFNALIALLYHLTEGILLR